MAGPLHIRPALDRDMARLARIQSRTAVGLVLAGGGARGLAHLGVLRALHARGIEVDWVGGTSIGAVMASYAASDQPLDTVMANARRAFATNPTGDFNLFPVLSLIKGLRLKHILRTPVRVDFEAMPGSWALLRDRLRPAHRRRYRLPSLPSLPSYLLTVTILYSMSRQRSAQQQCDLYFNPPLHRVGLLQWRRLENIVQRGYAHAVQVLGGVEQTR